MSEAQRPETTAVMVQPVFVFNPRIPSAILMEVAPYYFADQPPFAPCAAAAASIASLENVLLLEAAGTGAAGGGSGKGSAVLVPWSESLEGRERDPAGGGNEEEDAAAAPLEPVVGAEEEGEVVVT